MDFLVLTEDPNTLMWHYPNANTDKIIAVDDLPSFPDKDGDVLLINPDLETYDSLSYTEDQHNPFLEDPEGVSLERISFENPGWESSNWTSSATSKGFATPGNRNSHLIVDFSPLNMLEVDPTVFIPDNSGVNDFVTIKFDVKNKGYAATLFIVDRFGRKVKTIAERKILPANGFFIWDGSNNSNQRVNMGPYIIYLELLSPDGDHKILRERVVVGNRF